MSRREVLFEKEAMEEEIIDPEEKNATENTSL